MVVKYHSTQNEVQKQNCLHFFFFVIVKKVDFKNTFFFDEIAEY